MSNTYGTLLMRWYLLLLSISTLFLLIDGIIFKVGFVGAIGAIIQLLSMLFSQAICKYVATTIKHIVVESYEIKFATSLWRFGSFATFLVVIVIVGSINQRAIEPQHLCLLKVRRLEWNKVEFQLFPMPLQNT